MLTKPGQLPAPWSALPSNGGPIYWRGMLNKLSALLLGLSAGAAYSLVFLLMAVQSACIPIPSEVIMPLAGYKLGTGIGSLIVLATVASIASNLGSIPAY